MAWLPTVGHILVLCNLLITAYGNATIAEPGQFPFHVSLQNSYSNEHMCSGVIIGNEWILTVGHCVEELAHVGELRALVGTTKSKSDGVPYKIRSVTIHPQYRKSIARQHDIAMLRTKTKMKFNKKVNAIKLSPQIAIVDEDMVVSGWGMSKVSSSPFIITISLREMFQPTPKPIRNSNFQFPLNVNVLTGLVSNDLMFEETTIISNYECMQRMAGIHMTRLIYDYSVCTLARSELGTCHAEAGSPLINSKNELVAIAGWGKSCALGYPDVYTAIQQHLPFIRKVINRAALNEFANLLKLTDDYQ